jgi:hypothetical protein
MAPQVDLPNTTQTRKEFDVDLRALEETKSPKARISVIFDVENEFIITAVKIRKFLMYTPFLDLNMIKNCYKFQYIM